MEAAADEAATRSELIQHEAVQARYEWKDHTEHDGMQGASYGRAAGEGSRADHGLRAEPSRLEGKVMCLGLGATLQVLLGSDGRGGDPLALDRVQEGALVATCIKLGKACATVEALESWTATT